MNIETQTPFSQATQWLARVDEPVRATILKHWAHYKVDEGQTSASLTVTNDQQIALIEKAVGEHHPVLLPDFHATIGRTPTPLQASRLSTLERQIVGDDDAVLRTHTRLRVLMTRGNYGTVVLEAPGFTTREEVALYTKRLFGEARGKVTEQPIGGSYRVVMPVYDFKRAVDVLSKPVGYRALPGRTAEQRGVLEDQFRMMMGLEERPKEREMEAVVQDLGIKKALEELTRDYRVMFSDNLRDGVYSLPVQEADSLIARGAAALMANGTLAPEDAAFTGTGATRMLHISPSALLLLEASLYDGIQGKDGAVPSILSPEAAQTADRYFASMRLDEVRHDLLKAQLARMDAPMRAEVNALVGDKNAAELLTKESKPGPIRRVALEVLSRAVESVASAHDAKTDRPYDVDALRSAIARGRAVLAEPSFWRAHENSQLVSQHNSIRGDHDAALRDLDALIGSQPMSQAGLGLLLASPRFAEAIRDTGHFLAIAQDAHKQGFDNGAEQYQNAFQLTRAALEPRSSEARAASYHIRSDIGKVGIGEAVGRNLFMGIRPIISSVDLAVKKPILCGGAIVGIAAYSSMVPKQYSIPRLLNDLMHSIMESFNIPHGDSKAGLKLEKMAEETLETIKKSGGSDSYRKGFAVGRKFGVGQTAAIGAGLFVAFNLVEDVIVHLPLALVSVGVGAAGGATGRKVLSPVFNDIGDIAGRFSPEPVREAFRADRKLLKQAGESGWLGRMSHGVGQFGRDLDEFGIVTTTHHAIYGTQQQVASLFHQVMGNTPEKAAAR